MFMLPMISKVCLAYNVTHVDVSLIMLLLKMTMTIISKVCLAYNVTHVDVSLIMLNNMDNIEDNDDDDDNIKGLFGEARTSKRETSAVRFGMFLRSLENSHLKKKKKK